MTERVGTRGLGTAVLEMASVPPSLNRVGSRGGHMAWHRKKKVWQTDLERLLMAERVPRGLWLVKASALLRFPVRRGRDEGNFRALLEKALGDALVNGGWLPEDTPEHYLFERVEFSGELGAPWTVVRLTYEWGGTPVPASA